MRKTFFQIKVWNEDEREYRCVKAAGDYSQATGDARCLMNEGKKARIEEVTTDGVNMMSKVV